ncbi:MAG: cytidine deaminase [Kiritimatiellae bacterium]|nr:cytidine deaminase [Kiritimatiellia bacterium]
MTLPSDLLEAARSAMNNAHAPYSNFKVGAALLTADGQIFSGCNVENASFGLTICAERNAIFSAITAGAKDFSDMVIISTGSALPYPCGACRQVLVEFCTTEFKIHVVAENNLEVIEELTLGELLPKRFTL